MQTAIAGAYLLDPPSCNVFDEGVSMVFVFFSFDWLHYALRMVLRTPQERVYHWMHRPHGKIFFITINESNKSDFSSDNFSCVDGIVQMVANRSTHAFWNVCGNQSSDDTGSFFVAFQQLSR